VQEIAFARGARGGLAAILMPSAVNTASKELAGLGLIDPYQELE